MLGLLKRMKFLYYANKLLSTSSDNCLKNNFIQSRTLMLTANCKTIEETANEDTKKKRKKTVPLQKITLENLDGSTSIVLLEEANKIAKRHNMFLIKMPYIDTKGSREVYKIVDRATYINDIASEDQVKHQSKTELKSNKSTKNFTISVKIAQYDLDTKLNNMNKLLKKRHPIHIVISCPTENTNKEEIVEYIKKKLEGTIVTDKIKGNNVILYFAPQKSKNDDDDDDL